MQFYTKKRRPPQINIVTLIDILSILLIFFIVTTTFKQREPEVELDLPESSTAEESASEQQPVIIYVTKDEKILISDKEVKLENLKTLLEDKLKTTDESLFGLKSDAGVPFGLIIKIMDAAKEADIENLSVYTQPPEENSP